MILMSNIVIYLLRFREGYFTTNTSPTLKPVPAGMVPVIVHLTCSTQ